MFGGKAAISVAKLRFWVGVNHPRFRWNPNLYKRCQAVHLLCQNWSYVVSRNLGIPKIRCWLTLVRGNIPVGELSVFAFPHADRIWLYGRISPMISQKSHQNEIGIWKPRLGIGSIYFGGPWDMFILPAGNQTWFAGKSSIYRWFVPLKPPFAMDVPWFIVFSHGFPMVFPWFSHGFPMVFPWFSHGFPIIYSGISSHSCLMIREGRGMGLLYPLLTGVAQA